MTSVYKICRTCGHRCKRRLREDWASVGCRGVHETPAERALCPSGHGEMVREDGVDESYLDVLGIDPPRGAVS